MVVAIGQLQIFPDSCRHHLRQNVHRRVAPIHQEVVAQMPEMVGLVPDIAPVTRVLNAVRHASSAANACKRSLKLSGISQCLCITKAGIDQLQLGRGRDFHHTTSRMILPIAV